MNKGPYIVKLLDVMGVELAGATAETLSQAKKDARCAIKEKDYLASGMHSVEVCDADDVCVFKILFRNNRNE